MITRLVSLIGALLLLPLAANATDLGAAIDQYDQREAQIQQCADDLADYVAERGREYPLAARVQACRDDMNRGNVAAGTPTPEGHVPPHFVPAPPPTSKEDDPGQQKFDQWWRDHTHDGGALRNRGRPQG